MCVGVSKASLQAGWREELGKLEWIKPVTGSQSALQRPWPNLIAHFCAVGGGHRGQSHPCEVEAALVSRGGCCRARNLLFPHRAMTRPSVAPRPGESASAHETFTASTCSAARPRRCPPASASPAWCPCPLHPPLPRKCPQKVGHPLLARVLPTPAQPSRGMGKDVAPRRGEGERCCWIRAVLELSP